MNPEIVIPLSDWPPNIFTVPQHVFENQNLKDEQEKLRKKSLLLMLKVNEPWQVISKMWYFDLC